MEIRPAEESDIPEIIHVLKSSLGEGLMPKSIEFWHWKHEQNPFGKSPVLLATIEGKIVGVRAFLPWKWENEQREYRSLRAVDTAVLPEFQGKGIFSKLTKNLLEKCKTEDYDFVFNTPNKNSLPGYLKMGWQKAGKLPLQLQFHSLIPHRHKSTFKEMDKVAFENLAEKAIPLSNQLHTYISKEYLMWRYAHCPIAKYDYLTDGNTYFLIYRIKESKLGREFRIADIFGLNERKKLDYQYLNQQLKSKTKELKVNFTAYLQSGNHPKILKGMGKLPVLKIGPEFTLRNLNMEDDFQKLLNHRNWSYALGDLEVF